MFNIVSFTIYIILITKYTPISSMSTDFSRYNSEPWPTISATNVERQYTLRQFATSIEKYKILSFYYLYWLLYNNIST